MNPFHVDWQALLVKDGKLQRQNMRKEMLTKDDVMEQLREHGVDEISLVKQCVLESDGHFSVVTLDDEGQDKSDDDRSPLA